MLYNRSISKERGVLRWQKQNELRLRASGQGLQQRKTAEIICLKYVSPMGLYARNADAENTPTFAHGIPASASPADVRPQLPQEP